MLGSSATNVQKLRRRTWGCDRARPPHARCGARPDGARNPERRPARGADGGPLVGAMARGGDRANDQRGGDGRRTARRAGRPRPRDSAFVHTHRGGKNDWGARRSAGSVTADREHDQLLALGYSKREDSGCSDASVMPLGRADRFGSRCHAVRRTSSPRSSPISRSLVPGGWPRGAMVIATSMAWWCTRWPSIVG